MALILQLVFLVIPLLFVGFGVLIGRRLKWQFSVGKIVIIAVSAIISALVAAAISNSVSHIFADMLIESGLLGEFVDLATEVSSVKETACALAAMIVAPILYLPIFLIIRGILGLVNRLFVSRFYVKDGEGKNRVKTYEKNPWGLVAGAVCGLLLCSAVMLPTVETLTVVGTMSHVVADDIDDETTKATLNALADAEEVNASSIIVNITGGRLIYRMMTTYKVNDRSVCLFDEAQFLGAVEGVFLTATDESFSNHERAHAIREISNAFDKSEAFPMIVVDVVAAAQKDWDEGKEFCGIESPSFGEAHRSITDIFVDCIERSSYDTVKEDVGDVAEILAIVIENDCWDEIQADPVHFIANEDVTAKMLLVCVENERMYPAIDDIVDFGVDELFDSFGAYENKAEAYAEMLEEVKAISTESKTNAEIKAEMALIIKNHGLDVDNALMNEAIFADMDNAELARWLEENVVSSEADFEEKTSLVTPDQITDGEPNLTDPVSESDALAHVLGTAVDLVEHMGNDEMSASEILGGLGPVLDALVDTETFGKERTALLLKGILQSEKIYGEIGFTMQEATLVADKIIEGAETVGFEPMLLSLGQMVDVISTATTTSNIGDAVNVLLESLTPEAAEVIAAVATPDTMKNYGISEESADAASKLISDMFSKLSSAKGDMDEESFSKESDAVTDVVNIMMSSGIVDAEGNFGEAGKIGVEAEQYIDNIISSDVVSDAIIDSVYGEGETATLDPFGVGIELTESEMAQLETIINDKWLNASEEEKTEGDLDKLLVSIGAIVNADISIVNGEIVVKK